MIVLTAKIPVNPAKRDEFIAIIKDLVVASRQDAGCNMYNCLESVTEPNTFMMIEEYVDAAALQAHMAQPHTQAGLAKLPELLAGPPETFTYAVSEKEAIQV